MDAARKMNSWNDDRLDELSARIESGFARVNREMKEGFARVDREMKDGFARVDQEMKEGFARVDRKFEQIDERFDKLTQTMLITGGSVVGALIAAVSTLIAVSI